MPETFLGGVGLGVTFPYVVLFALSPLAVCGTQIGQTAEGEAYSWVRSPFGAATDVSKHCGVVWSLVVGRHMW